MGQELGRSLLGVRAQVSGRGAVPDVGVGTVPPGGLPWLLACTSARGAWRRACPSPGRLRQQDGHPVQTPRCRSNLTRESHSTLLGFIGSSALEVSSMTGGPLLALVTTLPGTEDMPISCLL